MKTFLFNAINKYKRFSESLEVKEAICNKSWNVFNDSGEKELYIFQEDGTLYITLNGKVSHGTWKYIPANKSIIISASEQSYMVHAAFMDSVIFALQVDGTEQCAFLIDEQNKQNFLPQTYSDVKNYFIAKETKYIEAEQRRKQQLIEEEKERQRQLEEERIRQQQKEEKERLEEELRKRAREIRGKNSWHKADFSESYGIAVLLCTSWLILVLVLFPILNIDEFVLVYITIGYIPAVLILALVHYIIRYVIVNRGINKWKKEHPNDPVIYYL